MSINIRGITDALVSHALTTGLFESVNKAEPKNKPGNGITGAVFLARLRPAPGASGLNTTTAVLEMMFRVYLPGLSQPYGDIDPKILAAADGLFAQYSGAFTLGGLVRNVDLLGEQGTPLAMQAGWLEQDNQRFRVVDITIPLIINDVYSQAG